MQNQSGHDPPRGGQQKEALRVSPQPQASSGKPESEPPKGQVVSKCVLPDIPLHRTAQQPTPTWRLPARCTSEQKPACYLGQDRFPSIQEEARGRVLSPVTLRRHRGRPPSSPSQQLPPRPGGGGDTGKAAPCHHHHRAGPQVCLAPAKEPSQGSPPRPRPPTAPSEEKSSRHLGEGQGQLPGSCTGSSSSSHRVPLSARDPGPTLRSPGDAAGVGGQGPIANFPAPPPTPGCASGANFAARCLGGGAAGRGSRPLAAPLTFTPAWAGVRVPPAPAILAAPLSPRGKPRRGRQQSPAPRLANAPLPSAPTTEPTRPLPRATHSPLVKDSIFAPTAAP